MGGAEILFLDQVKLLRKLDFEVASFSFTRNYRIWFWVEDWKRFEKSNGSSKKE